jgi:hypothetical protein
VGDGLSAALTSELSGVDLHDARLDDRLLEIVRAFVASPANSFPEMLRTSKELEAFYRFVNNERVTFDELAAPHCRASGERVNAAEGPVLVVHDATVFAFPYDEELREGCEQLTKTTQGFYGGVSLALSAESLEPLGVLQSDTWRKRDLTPKRPHQIKVPKSKGHGPGRISGGRWAGFIERSEGPVADTSKLVHVIDREADGFPLYSHLVASHRRFVVRLCRDRHVELDSADGEIVKLWAAAERAKPVHFEDVELSRRRAAKATKQHPARLGRTAKLSFAAMPITIPRSGSAEKSLPDSVNINFVCVRELNAPTGEEPVEWLLATSEPIDTADQIRAVVGYYRARWKIEEFFKTLKSGCAFEKRQLESMHALLNVLAISELVAWHVMLLRHLSRVCPNEPATKAFSSLELFVLRATGGVSLREKATVQEALYAVAGLGGHIKNNGYPGLITLSRGMEHLLERVLSFVLLLQTICGVAKK